MCIKMDLAFTIIVMSYRQHIYPWPSLSTSPYRSSPLAGLQGYIPYPHTDAVCVFELVVLLLLSHMWGSIGVHRLWARPACLVHITSFFSCRLVSVHVVHPYNSIDTTAAWKKLRFILSVRSDFHMIESLSIAVRAFVSRVLMFFFGWWDTAS